MLDQSGQTFGRFAAIGFRRYHHVDVPLRSPIPDHNIVGMSVTPPRWCSHANARQQQGVWVGVDNRLALGVDARPVNLFTGPRPRPGDGKAHEIHAHLGSHLDLVHKRPGGAAQKRERLARSVEGNGQFAGRFSSNPKAHPIPMPLVQ